MTHYLIAQLNSGYFSNRSVASPEAIQAMHTPGQGAFYGRGWYKARLNGVPAIFHEGVVSNYQALVAFSPEEGWGVVVPMNVRSVLPASIPMRVARGRCEPPRRQSAPAATGALVHYALRLGRSRPSSGGYANVVPSHVLSLARVQGSDSRPAGRAIHQASTHFHVFRFRITSSGNHRRRAIDFWSAITRDADQRAWLDVCFLSSLQCKSFTEY
jgi:hypothetical protein